ncbi:3-hydroxyacyl-CoA dehydrogenase NAD-binding domain-containing protein [Pseudovibrio sp. WM33]|uniref:3-hydroxyacyl-CoA dehydrogenase NAD-binding domain-containing protein n=1 Tax=Pseudovibrio sp. WM33 TaxID=1735585 RepID=UPI0007AE7C23|nr:3-hydroxyacyl-CoA dehydrogenase NAD-binding domain-containing protein [Pseudovibrio sp. WM33]KZL19737.1 Fatty acid oxidation complex subunit alpha [Pseudovibrio sp. WM33]
MTYTHFTLETDADGFAVLKWDSPEKPMNVFDESVILELDKVVDDISADDAIKGVIVASGKKAFSAGADLSMIGKLLATFKKRQAVDAEGAAKDLFDGSRKLSQVFRKLETSGKPYVAAVNGVCMGGGTELALACHKRIGAEESLKMALPEVKVGLFPGGGGTQRVMRMVGDLQGGLQFLLLGQTLDAKKAMRLKLIEAVAPEAELIAAAKKMLADGVDAAQPWDKKGFKIPTGKVYSPSGMQFWPAANAIYRQNTYDNYPGARYMLHSVVEGLMVPMDTGLTIESRYFAHVLQSKEAAAMVRSLFGSMQELNKGARRPAGVPKTQLKKIGVLGAGMMGAGIAYVTAKAGLEVVLIDQSQEAADKGKAYSEGLLDKAIKRSKSTPEKKEKLLSLITATTDYNALSDVDLVIEAVFEDREVKRIVTEKAEAAMPASAVYASNTSTLPITSLAEASSRPADFIGIHFFSPVDKMMLVEIILGEKTEDKATAVALDYVKAIKKTPIVVNDSRGFYTSRVVGTYVREGIMMLSDGVPAAMIENAGKMAGMPVGPLSLGDEVALDLAWKIKEATKKDLGDAYPNSGFDTILDAMVVKNERFGRKNTKGFYDYKGKDKALWPGITDITGPSKSADEFDVEELKDRLLGIQALETARVFEENCLTDVREADVGSILGFGFAPFSGGTLSYIDGIGTKEFVERCDKLAAKWGDRFAPNKQLRAMADAGETYYGKFSPAEAVAEAAE